MNVFYHGSRFGSIESAVDHSLGTGYTGSELQKLQQENEMLRSMLCRVVAVIANQVPIDYSRSDGVPGKIEYIRGPWSWI